MCTSIIPLSTRFLLLKNEKLNQLLIMPSSMIKICFKRKGFPWDHAKLNRFIYIKNIAITLWICNKIVVTIVIVIKCAINLQSDHSKSWVKNYFFAYFWALAPIELQFSIIYMFWYVANQGKKQNWSLLAIFFFSFQTFFRIICS